VGAPGFKNVPMPSAGLDLSHSFEMTTYYATESMALLPGAPAVIYNKRYGAAHTRHFVIPITLVGCHPDRNPRIPVGCHYRAMLL
jgi:hypothetical protein